MLLTSLLLFTVTVKLIDAKFPGHDIIATDQELDERDAPACGLYKQPNDGRIWRGENVTENQFPWVVCLIAPWGKFSIRYPNGTIKNRRGYLSLDIYDFALDSHTRSDLPAIKVEFTQIRSWVGYCTGSIVNSNWILTAAHCLHHEFEGSVITINAGVDQCLTERHGNIREVIVQRSEGPTRTIFEHSQYIYMRGEGLGVPNFDFALIRLSEPLNIPINNYNNEPINSICLFSVARLVPESGCLNDIYFAGFGMKNDQKRNISIMDPTGELTGNDDPGQKLTYLKMFRTSFNFCAFALGGTARYGLFSSYCYSSVLKDFETDKKKDGSITKPDVGVWNVTEIRNIPDTCAGDSGGPFMYYVKLRSDAARNNEMLRAVQVSTLFGGESWGEQDMESNCEGSFTRGKDAWWKKYKPHSRGWYKALNRGPQLHKYLEWFGDRIFDQSYTGRPTMVAPIHRSVHFPAISQNIG